MLHVPWTGSLVEWKVWLAHFHPSLATLHIVHPSNIIDYTLVHHITALLSDWLTDGVFGQVHRSSPYSSTSLVAICLYALLSRTRSDPPPGNSITPDAQFTLTPTNQPTNEPANVHFDFSSSEHSIQCTLLGTFLPVPASIPEVCLPDPICPLKVYIKSIHEFNNIVWQTIYSLLDLIKEPSCSQSVTVCVCWWVLPPLPE